MIDKNGKWQAGNVDIREATIPRKHWRLITRESKRIKKYYENLKDVNAVLSNKEELNRILGEVMKVYYLMLSVRDRCVKFRALFEHEAAKPFEYLVPVVPFILENDQIGNKTVAEMLEIYRIDLLAVAFAFDAMEFWVEGRTLGSEDVDMKGFLDDINEYVKTGLGGQMEVKCGENVCGHFNKSTVAMLLINMAKNAALHGRADLVEITIKREGGHIVVEVCDNGSGIGDEVTEEMFEWGKTGSESGNGIGLADARERMAQFGGAINNFERHGGLANNSGGRGAKFILTLPLVEPKREEPNCVK